MCILVIICIAINIVPNNYIIKCIKCGAKKVAQWIRTLAALVKIQVQFLAPQWWFIIIPNSSSMESDGVILGP